MRLHHFTADRRGHVTGGQWLALPADRMAPQILRRQYRQLRRAGADAHAARDALWLGLWLGSLYLTPASLVTPGRDQVTA